MPHLMIRGQELYFEERGSGAQTVVFSHGLLMNLRMYDAQMAALSGDFRCIAYDHRGQGLSEVPDAPMIDMETLYDDAATLIEALGGGPVHFVGMSMGGFVGLRLAARRPDLVRSLTLIDTTAEPESPHQVAKFRRLSMVARAFSPGSVAGKVMPLMFGSTFLTSADRQAERALWEHMLRQHPRSIFRAVDGVLYRPGVVAEAKRITVPTLILHGVEDRMVPRHRAEMLAELTGGRLTLVAQSGHCPPVEQPEVVNQELRRFLEGIRCNEVAGKLESEGRGRG